MFKTDTQIGHNFVITAVTLCAFLFGNGSMSMASANAVIPDNQKAMLSIQGKGVSPNAQISLTTGPTQTIITKADKEGNFRFSNLKYASFADLKFSLDIPSYSNAVSRNYPANKLEFTYDGRESLASIKGQIGRSSTLSFSMAGSEQTPFQVAGEEGYVRLQARTEKSLASGDSQLTASIINVAETCCPRLIIPASPILLTISSQPVFDTLPQAVDTAKKPVSTRQPIVPKSQIVPNKNTGNTKQLPIIRAPQKEEADKKEEVKPKKKVPYIIQGRIDMDETLIHTDTLASAVSFTAADYDRTYVGGLKKMADEMRRAVMLNMVAMGSFLDARNLNDTMRSIQISTVQTLVNYTPSNSVCSFGTLSRSLVKADANSKANQLAFSKIMQDRSSQKASTIYAKVNVGTFAMIQDFKKKYCNVKTNGGFLQGYCQNATATPDSVFDRDVDFTRVFDVPLTLDADFTNETMTEDKHAVIALFNNLSKSQPIMGSGQIEWNPKDNSIMAQDYRALLSMKNISNNSFAALVSEKAKTTSAVSTHMNNIMVKLGLSTADATKLLGANPSYFAQMEVMTKKLFQDPSFYASLYESEANIDRQRVAMKAIELQQERDFLESLRRREMLLSVLLNSKLEKPANNANNSGVIRDDVAGQ